MALTDETVLSNIDFNGQTARTIPGQHLTLGADFRESSAGHEKVIGAHMVLTSSNTSVAVPSTAEVVSDNSGNFLVDITTVATGTATITGTPKDIKNPNNLTWTATITVVSGPVSIVITPSTGNVSVGGFLPVNVAVKNAGGQEIDYLDGKKISLHWTCDTPTLGVITTTISSTSACALSSGVFDPPEQFRFSGVAPGTATFHVSANAGSSLSAAVATISVAPAGTKVVFADPSKNPSIFTTQSFTLSATVQDQSNTVINGIPITYSLQNASDANYVTLNAQTGQVTAKNTLDQPSRTIEVVASAIQNGQTLATSSSLVTVRSRAQTISVVPPSPLTLLVGQSAQAVAVVTPEPNAPTSPAINVVWSSSDQTKVSVDAVTGIILAKAPTTTPVTITANAEGRLSSALSVNVQNGPGPSITFSPTTNPLAVGVAAGIQLTATVQNPITGGTLSLVVRDPTLATFTPSTTTATSITGSLTGKGTGSTFIDATYTAGSTVVTQSIPVTVGGSSATSIVARVIMEPINATVTMPVGFTYRPRFFDANGVELTSTQVIADGGTVSFFNTSDAVGTVVKSVTLPTTAQFTPAGAGTENVTVLYAKNGQNIATDNTNVTVNASTAGNLGSLQLAMTGPGTAGTTATRQLHVNETALVQIVVRDQGNFILTSGVTGLSLVASPSSSVTITPTTPPAGQQGFYYLVTAKEAGIVTLTATGPGVSTGIKFLIVP